MCTQIYQLHVLKFRRDFQKLKIREKTQILRCFSALFCWRHILFRSSRPKKYLCKDLFCTICP